MGADPEEPRMAAGAAVRNVSVVIPVRDDPLLGHALASVPPGAEVEVVVALTRPSAAVEAIAAEGRSRDPRVRVVRTERTGMSAGVNLGARHATHEKIVVLDSDCRLEPRALEAYARALDRAPFVRGRTLVDRAGGWSAFAGLGAEEMNRRFAVRPRLMGPSIAFRKEDFLRLGGYDEACGASCDHEFVLRMEAAGVPTLFEPDAAVRHQPITFRIDTRAHYGYGRGMRYIDRKHGNRYGLRVCLERFHPRALWAKLTGRGPLSVVRSLLLGTLMLAGYAAGRGDKLIA